MEDQPSEQQYGYFFNLRDESNLFYDINHDFDSNQYYQQPKKAITQYTPHQQQQPTRKQASMTVAQTKHNTKNTPKTIGNYIRRKVQEIEKQGPQFDRIIPAKLKIFKDKKVKGRQANYGLREFRDMLSDQASAKFSRQFFENQIFLEILHSNRIKDPMTQIAFIEQYIRGTMNPQVFISNRTKEHIKLQQKEKNS